LLFFVFVADGEFALSNQKFASLELYRARRDDSSLRIFVAGISAAHCDVTISKF